MRTLITDRAPKHLEEARVVLASICNTGLLSAEEIRVFERVFSDMEDLIDMGRDLLVELLTYRNVGTQLVIQAGYAYGKNLPIELSDPGER